jgi:thymidylate synthase (FAD)
MVDQSFEVVSPVDGQAMLRRIEAAGRTCYKSEDKITDSSAEQFVRMIIKRGHHSVLEHESISVRFVCSRGITHELVRHRIASYSQESTRYCNYSKGKFGWQLTLAPMLVGLTDAQIARRERFYRQCEELYLAEIEEGISPQQARDNLLICLKAEIVMTANFREWRHFFSLRTSLAAHPQMRKLSQGVLVAFRCRIPVVFDDVGRVDCACGEGELLISCKPAPNDGWCFVSCNQCGIVFGERASEPQAWAVVREKGSNS